ncbi:nucleotidyl transferase AbiEii/AbiGii toxin family protein [Micromonospora sp. URMC 105]|uniref:nucleotidyl transferase AbiEii/AbiGii toxin family protein n=1 Tax=Micromonospora sp. URMC 105 TaxID=3423413 RepID=UPI003F1D0F8D
MTERYGSVGALRRALKARLMQEANDTGTILARRRRLVVFDRDAARLSTDPAAGWILKGGTALKSRLHSKARATKDMVLAACPDGDPDRDGQAVRNLLIDALSREEDGDGFLLQVPSAVLLRADATDRRQHFAEKIHTLTRDYGDRPNTRVKDLVDLVLVIESGLAPDDALADAVRHVFAVRATHPVPKVLPDPPPAWNETYLELADGLTATPLRLDVAMGLIRGFWSTALASGNIYPEQKD